MSQDATASSATTGVSVAVFAHNEASEIEGSLDALRASGLGPADPIHVVVNGSTDGTERIVRRLSEADSRLHASVLNFGDKSNAWNHYVHRLADPGLDHVFLDGDVRPAAGAVAALRATLNEHPACLAASALPRGGRKSAGWAREIVANHGMPGNLYALRAATVARMRRDRFFLPVGSVGDDTFLRWILLRAFVPHAAPERGRIQPSMNAFFEYESFPITDLGGLRAIYGRQKRYSRRDMEMQLLVDALRAKGMDGLPRYVSELYPNAKLTTPLRGTKRLRQLFFLSSYMFARRNERRVPDGDPWSAVFVTPDGNL